jgi:hypothetical protein
MLQKSEGSKPNSSAGGMEQISQALHDLCQPLTTLQCRLEIAQLGGTAQDYRDAVELGLVECDRLIEGVGLMRQIVRESRAGTSDDVGVRR